jgi:hypothetical protein
MFEHFRTLADASLPQIHLMARDLDLPHPVRVYAQAVSFFMSGDIERLEVVHRDVDKQLANVDCKIKSQVQSLISFRLQLRHQNVTPDSISRIHGKEFDDVLDAEKFFLLGRAWESLGDDNQGGAFSMQAAAIYKRCRCPKKALRAFYNSIVADSRVLPYKNFISEYQAVIEMSKQVQDLAFAGMALTMLSREYQIVGLVEKSLSTVEEGLLSLESERGSLHFFYALLQKAHLLMENGKPHQAENILLETQMSSFPEIHATKRFLECLMDPKKSWSHEEEKLLIPTWRERLPQIIGRNLKVESNQTIEATMLEERLLKTLWSGPVAKWDLIERIYPNESDSLALENRFKNLVARVRKKFPGVLQFHDGQYFVESKTTLSI